MSQSLAKIYLHCIFSTKHRQPYIKDSIRKDLYAYMIGILSNLHSYVEEMGRIRTTYTSFARYQGLVWLPI